MASFFFGLRSQPDGLICRAGRKDPDKHVEDLEKARWYLDREIERVKGD